jgi:thiol-disulfide isomerase/thioredoxin
MTVNKSFERPDRDLVAALAAMGSATLHEAMGQRGALPSFIKPIYPGLKVAGPALTVDGKPADNLAVHYAITLAQPGDVMVVDFWASWCGPCKQSFPVYEELQRTYADRGVVIIAVNVDRNRRDMEKFLARHAVSFAVVRDAAQKLVRQVAPPAMPTAFVLDRRRAVRFVHLGFHGEKSRLEYITEINALLSETP